MAPCFIASTAVSMFPYAVSIMQTGFSGMEIVLSITLMPDFPAMRRSVITASKGSASSILIASSASAAAKTSYESARTADSPSRVMFFVVN